MKRGFTLIELLVVMTIIAIIATLALFGIGKAQASARDVKREQIMTGLQATLNRYYGDNNGYYVGTNKFCSLISALTSGHYIQSGPVDPDGTVVCAEGATDDSPVGSVVYSYTGSATAYELTLTKEAGGQNSFFSPQ